MLDFYVKLNISLFQKLFWFEARSNVYICFCFTYNRGPVYKNVLLLMIWKVLPMLSSTCFIVVSPEFDLDFISDMELREWSNFIFLHVTLTFSQQQIDPTLLIGWPCHLNQGLSLTIYSFMYFWTFNSDPLIPEYILVPIHTFLSKSTYFNNCCSII